LTLEIRKGTWGSSPALPKKSFFTRLTGWRRNKTALCRELAVHKLIEKKIQGKELGRGTGVSPSARRASDEKERG